MLARGSGGVCFLRRVGLLDCYCWVVLLLFVRLVFWMIGLMGGSLVDWSVV